MPTDTDGVAIQLARDWTDPAGKRHRGNDVVTVPADVARSKIRGGSARPAPSAETAEPPAKRPRRPRARPRTVTKPAETSIEEQP